MTTATPRVEAVYSDAGVELRLHVNAQHIIEVALTPLQAWDLAGHLLRAVQGHAGQRLLVADLETAFLGGSKESEDTIGDNSDETGRQ